MSIVIPAYNHGRFLAEAIDSVLAQDYPAIALTVIDDGSTDETPQVLSRYSGRCQTVTQVNAGQATTINRAWQNARGDILSYLSADDRLATDAVSAAVAVLNDRPEAVMAYGDFDLIDPNSAVIRHIRAPEFSYERMVRHLECAPGPGVFVRRAAAERIDGWNPQFRQAPDFEYWLRLGLLGPFVHIPRSLAALRVHPGSASFAATTAERAEEPVRIIESFFRRPDIPQGLRDAQRQALSSAHLLAARAHVRAGRLVSGTRSARRAAALYPGNMLTGRAGRLLLNALVNRPAHAILWSIRRNRRRADVQ